MKRIKLTTEDKLHIVSQKVAQYERVPQKCGCINCIDGTIDFCPLHLAAPRLLDALEGCVKWIEPVMDGFLVEEKAKSRINLEKAKVLLSECRGKSV